MSADSRSVLRALPWRLVLFALLWLLLTGGRSGSWTVGGPFVLAAALASAWARPEVPWSLRGLLRLVPFFLRHSLLGGLDVARRALSPAMPLAPELVEYRLRLPPGPAPVFMANLASLLPGTLAVEVGERALLVHVLDVRGSYREELDALERHVAALFRIPPTAGDKPA